MKIDTCSTCLYSLPLTVNAGAVDLAALRDGQLACRRFPPQPYPVGSQGGQIGSITVVPTVRPSDWCGEYKVQLPAE